MLKKAIARGAERLRKHPQAVNTDRGIFVSDKSGFCPLEGGHTQETRAVYGKVFNKRISCLYQEWRDLGPVISGKSADFGSVRITSGGLYYNVAEYIQVRLRPLTGGEVSLDIDKAGKLRRIKTEDTTIIRLEQQRRGLRQELIVRVDGLTVRIPSPKRMIRRWGMAELAVDILER